MQLPLGVLVLNLVTVPHTALAQIDADSGGFEWIPIPVEAVGCPCVSTRLPFVADLIMDNIAISRKASAASKMAPSH
jgi:hypothetical protein